MDIADLRLPVLIPALHQDEGHAVDDQGNGHHHRVVQVLVHPVVKEHAHHPGGDDGGNDHEPKPPGLLFPRRVLARVEGVQLAEEQSAYRQDRSQLDHHVEHALEFLGHVQVYKFVQQNQVPRGGNGQPFGDALHNAEEDGFQNFNDVGHFSFSFRVSRVAICWATVQLGW